MTKPQPFIGLFIVALLAATPGFAAKNQSIKISATLKKAVTKTSLAPKHGVAPDVAAILKDAPTAAQFPDAAAATVLDASDVTILPDGTIIEKNHEMLRIFNDRAQSESDIALPYSSSTDKFSGLSARTILPNGGVVPLNLADVHVTSPFAGYAMYDDSKVASFSMPGVQNGAIIDYSYTITHKPLMANDFSETWMFADGSYPVKTSRFRVTAPSTLKLNSQILNADGLKSEVSTVGGMTTYVWSMSNLPDIDREPMMPPARQIFPMIQVSSLGSWQDVAHWYWSLAKSREVITPTLHQLVLDQTAGKTTDEEKAKALFYWVEENIRYVAVELGQSAWQPHPAEEVYENRYGDCKDMATLLVTLLHDAGISDAYPVLLQAESNQPIESTLPTTQAFDHCIARATIDGKQYWFDCTAQICGFGDIPGGDRGANVLVVDSTGTGDFNTIPDFSAPQNSLDVVQKVTLNPDGSALCADSMVAHGDGDLSLRGTFRSIKPSLITDGVRNMVNHESNDSTLIDYKVSDVNDRDTPFSLSYSYSAPDFAQKTGNLLLYTPAPFGGAMGSFIKPTRKYPIYTQDISNVSTSVAIQIPVGYKVDDLPDPMNQSLPFADYSRTVEQDGQTISINFQISMKKSETPANQYSALQAELAQLRQTINEPVVLKKIAP